MSDDAGQLNLPEREEKILKFWEENQIFEKTLSKTKKGRPFIFYEGPPFANGHPGIHHVEARVLKDVFLRFKTMQGYFVRRKAGWDTHGLPVELQVEKELGLKNKRDIERYGIGAFNQKCRESVWKYKNEWDQFTKRIGFWLDLENPYITYETPYIESLWYIIKRFWRDKNLYQDYKIIPWCSRCGTGLSSHELGQPGAYRTVKDPSIFVKFPIKGKKDEFLLVWTTTPWTLPGNVLVAVNPDIEYARIEYKNNFSIMSTERENGTVTSRSVINPGIYILAKDIFWKHIQSNAGLSEIRSLLNILPEDLKKDAFQFASNPSGFFEKHKGKIEIVKGKDLIGFEYEAPYPQKNIPYRVIAGDFVTTEDGTGIVHIAPAFGEDDMTVAKKEFGEKYPILRTVTSEGKMGEGIIGEGTFVKSADKTITADLDKRRLLLKLQWYEHDYPFCWRCDTPLIYLARESWWVKKPVAKLLANNKKINWHPDHIQDGRFGEWLKEPKDWAFSRERYWGVPLPIWKCEACKAWEVLGSIDELKEKIPQPQNSYTLMRHGEAESNMRNVIDDTLTTYHLTERGKKQVVATIKKLKKTKFDFIYASPILRTKETAEMVAEELGAEIFFDDRLQEIHLGEFRGKSPKEYHARFPTHGAKFKNRPQGGENLVDLRARLMSFIQEIDAKNSGKNILIISHEYSLWILSTAGVGMDEKEIIAEKLNRGKDFIKTADTMKFSFVKLPYSHTGEVDVHRPFIDAVSWQCACGGIMRRVPDVCDVWFDSGAMPFAEDHWPFQSRITNQKSQIKNPKEPELFPAEFICEGVDQTRGWFYTLLTVSTLLGFPSPYKNVVSLGHVLDKNGQKMSKSKGNMVDPHELIRKYGADAVRWYFYTVNAPWDAKAFDEKDVAGRLRGFLNTFWNSLILVETYAPKKIQNPKSNGQRSKNILDKWVLSRLNGVTKLVTENLNRYEPVVSARAIEEFLIKDFSQWYLRRSRRRFQKPENETELQEVSAVSVYVLLELAKLSAPFIPFFAEIIFQRLQRVVGAKEMSVHLADWPKKVQSLKLKVKSQKNIFDKQVLPREIESQMDIIRVLTAEAMKLRAEACIKVRQPLASFTIKKSEYKQKQFLEELLKVLKDEANVKEVLWGDEFLLDIKITPELKEEGTIRELIRNIQEMRKDGGFIPKDHIVVSLVVFGIVKGIIERWSNIIKKEVGAKNISLAPLQHPRVEREISFDENKLKVAIAKA